MSKLLENINAQLEQIRYMKKEEVRLNESLASFKGEETKLEASITKNLAAFAVMTLLFEQLNKRGLIVLDNLIEGALATVYPDKGYKVRHVVREERGANQLTFQLVEKREDGKEVISNIRSGVGGGIRAVVGVVCTYYYIMKMGGQRLIVMDEALSQVSDVRIEALFALLKSLGEEAGFTLILITHDSRFRPYLDVEYRMYADGVLKKVSKSE